MRCRPVRTPPEQRFSGKVEKSDGCWRYTGNKDHRGYGKFFDGERLVCAHRFAYRLANGPIPEGMLVMHTCDHPWCVRPDHLVLGTPQDNMDDMYRKGRERPAHRLRTTCRNGHPLVKVASNGKRGCRVCMNARRRKSVEAAEWLDAQQGEANG